MAYPTPTPPGGNPVDNLTHPPKATPPKKGGGPTPIKLAPGSAYTPPGKKATGERSVFIAFLKAHPALNKPGFATAIWNAAGRFGGITATQIAAVIWAESKGDPTATSGAGAHGYGQILDNAASVANASGVAFFRPNHNISRADKENIGFVANYIAWRIGGYMAANGATLDDAWRKGYGGDQPGNYVSQYLPKGYVGIGGTTAPQSAGRTNDTGNALTGLRDPYMVAVTAKGQDGKMHLVKMKKVLSDTVPKGTVNYDGIPMRLSDWNQLARGLEQYFVSYTGGRPSADMLYKYVTKGWSPYSLTVALANSKKFVGSPIYKSQAPSFQEAAKDVVAPGASVPQSMIRSAIVNNWTTQEFQAILRKDPGYLQSNEFKQNTTTLLNVHQSIMGIPDQGAINGLHQAALAGWTPDQYASYLRSQPQYTSSPEYQYKTLSFLQGLGLITGQNPVLKKGIAPDVNPNPNLAGNLPDSSRLPAGSLSRPEDTVATYDG